jgi:hypothetical protein
MKLHNAQNGDTPLKIVHRLMTEDMGEQTPIDKARVANQLLKTNVEKIEDLSDAELAELTGKLLKGLYG